MAFMNKRQVKKVLTSFGIERTEVIFSKADGLDAIGMIGDQAAYIHIPPGELGYFRKTAPGLQGLLIQELSLDQFRWLKELY